jgi:ABC-type multidrug transport system fused ATPase/permease subunit
MEKTLFKFIWRYSKRDQIILLVMTALSFPFLYFSLDLPKIIINKAISGKDIPSDIFGVSIDQVEYLLILSVAFLMLVCINGGFKFYVNVFRGQLGERMLRRLRFDLLSRVLRFPLPQFRRVSQGEVIQMVTAEVEPLGGFVGDSIALPCFSGRNTNYYPYFYVCPGLDAWIGCDRIIPYSRLHNTKVAMAC